MANRNLVWTSLLVGRLACLVLAGHGGGGYTVAGSSSGASANAASSFTSLGCMACLCQAATGCDVNKQCVGDVCGAFAISWQYWKDAGQPGGDYVSCANNPSCALGCVQSYVNKFAQDCDGNGVVDCADAARLHRLGRTGCRGWLDNEFASRLSSCDASAAQQITSIFTQAKRLPSSAYTPAATGYVPNYQNEVSSNVGSAATGFGCSTCSQSSHVGSAGSAYVGSSGSSSGSNYAGSYGGSPKQSYVGSSGSSSGSNYAGSYGGSPKQSYVGSSGLNSGSGYGSSAGYVGSTAVETSYTGSYVGNSGSGYSGSSYSGDGSSYGGKYGQNASPRPVYQDSSYDISAGSAASSASSSAHSTSGLQGYSGAGRGSSGTGVFAGGSGFSAGNGYRSSAAGSYSDTAISDHCLTCICTAATGCSLSAGCNHAGCGPLRISRAYWIDAGSPGGDYEGCTNNLQCSMNCAKTYLTKYAKDCDGDGVVQCGDYARIHRLGAYGCHGQLDWDFQRPLNTCSG